MRETDVAVIGGGIIGLATAWQISRAQPDLDISVLEKERELASHQTGRNSGVIHSGIYYPPGSLKAVNCREGKIALQAFCDDAGIEYDICGKVIVAVDDSQLKRLNDLYLRGQENQVQCRMINREQLVELEPFVNGIAAIHVNETGIVDFRQVAWKLAQQVCESGNSVKTESEVKSIECRTRQTILETNLETVQARLVINCAGLHSDRIGQMLGAESAARIVPFRGEYFTIRPTRSNLCRNLIYPVPDPRFPFLGVHFTRMMDGTVHCGPNAVLALAREGYRKTDWQLRDMRDSLLYRGFWRLASRHAWTGLGEIWRSVRKPAFVSALQQLIPEIVADDLVPAPPGIRAQALLPDGKLVDDFLIDEMPHAISVVNAPSPAATAALNIGKLIADRALARFR